MAVSLVVLVYFIILIILLFLTSVGAKYSVESNSDKVNELAVATSHGNTCKLYLFEILANKLKDKPEIYNGTGIPSEVMYMSPYMSNVYICY